MQVLANEEVMAYLNDVICLHLSSDLHCICKKSWMAVAIVKNESQSVSIITLTWQQMTAYSCTSVRLHSDYTSQLMLRIHMWLWWLSEGWENSQRLHLEDFFLLVLAVVLELTLVTLFCLFVCFFFFSAQKQILLLMMPATNWHRYEIHCTTWPLNPKNW